MKSVEIPDSLYEAIVEIGKQRKVQNNRATGDPLYFSVEDVVWTPAHEGCGERTVFYLGNETETYAIDELKEHLADYYEMDVPPEFDEWVKDEDAYAISVHLDKMGLPHRYGEESKSHVRSNVFFTEKACEEHIASNLHNLHDPHSYAEHAYRNHEMKSVIELIDLITKQDGAQ